MKNTSKDKIAGFVGDLNNMETSYIFKEFFDRTLEILIIMIVDHRAVSISILVKEKIIYLTPTTKWN